MNPERRQALSEAGIAVEAALERMMGSEALLEKLLGKFLQDKNLPALVSALAAGDQAEAVAASHALKGVCGNLSMEGLYALFTRQVDALRQGDWAAAQALMEEITPAYSRVVQAIGGRDGDG